MNNEIKINDAHCGHIIIRFSVDGVRAKLESAAFTKRDGTKVEGGEWLIKAILGDHEKQIRAEIRNAGFSLGWLG